MILWRQKFGLPLTLLMLIGCGGGSGSGGGTAISEGRARVRFFNGFNDGVNTALLIDGVHLRPSTGETFVESGEATDYAFAPEGMATVSVATSNTDSVLTEFATSIERYSSYTVYGFGRTGTRGLLVARDSSPMDSIGFRVLNLIDGTDAFPYYGDLSRDGNLAQVFSFTGQMTSASTGGLLTTNSPSRFVFTLRKDAAVSGPVVGSPITVDVDGKRSATLVLYGTYRDIKWTVIR